ncbi:MAG TPA: signal peptidase II [Gemmataceae bacterium]|nr:signal peptidase II [Gemmataceae bacterium]
MTMKADRSYRWLFWSLALIGLTLDQTSKYGVFAWLYNNGQGDTRALIPGPAEGVAKRIPGAFYLDAKFTPGPDTGEDFFRPLRTLFGEHLPTVNHGALWGVGGPGHGEEGTGMNTFFAVVSLVAAVAIIWWSTRASAARERWLSLSLGLILGGTLGNLYDRVVFSGVRDFLHWHYPPEPWGNFPVFNLADCCLVCGAFLLLIQAIYGQPDTEEQPLAAQAEQAAPPELAEAVIAADMSTRFTAAAAPAPAPSTPDPSPAVESRTV